MACCRCCSFSCSRAGLCIGVADCGLPQRWFVVLLFSLVASHLLVTLIAAFHLDPLLYCRVAVGIVIVVLVAAAVMWRLRANKAAAAER